MIRVGHKGADHVAPGNTAASFEAALEHGVDMIEFDVLPNARRRLVLAHDYADSERRECLTLEEGLELFAGEAFAGVELDVDLKLPGYEREVVEALRRARPRGALARVDDVPREPRPPAARSTPACGADGRCRASSATTCGRRSTRAARARAGAPGCAARMPAHGRARASARAAARRSCPTSVLVSPRLVRAVHGAGGELYVWTVDEAPKIRALEALGVDGVITNDPRLFDC